MDKYNDHIGGMKFICCIKDKFIIGDLLGKGTFGEVRKCVEIHKSYKISWKPIGKKHTSEKTEYALKIISKK